MQGVFKTEDQQLVRSYKLRGAYNLMISLPQEQLQKGVVCASAGNHAQGFAYSCKKLNVHGIVFMPVITPNQKINQTKMFGEDKIEVKLVGDNYDECAVAAKEFTQKNRMTLIHPFDDYRVIEGQGTVAAEILEQFHDPSDGRTTARTIDYLLYRSEAVVGCRRWFLLQNVFSQNKNNRSRTRGSTVDVRSFQAGKPVTLETLTHS
jgi:threonine dehydratase